MRTLLLTIALASSLPVAAHDAKEVKRAALGTWKSAAAEDLGNGTFGTRTFELKDGQWSIVFTCYADAKLSTPLFAFEAAGPWKVGEESPKVKGAHEAVFEFKSKKLTLLASAPEVAKNFGFAACGLTVGKAKDISKTGCSFFGSVEKAPREFDLVDLEGQTLKLGARPADGDLGTAEKRPTALGAPLERAAK
jgi:hypothetical protein